MSTTAMWLLLAVVVIVIVFASVLYKRTFTVHELALTGVMAALSLVAYLFFRVPYCGGSSFPQGTHITALPALLRAQADTSVFALLDLTRPGLERVAALHAAGAHRRNAVALLRHTAPRSFPA